MPPTFIVLRMCYPVSGTDLGLLPPDHQRVAVDGRRQHHVRVGPPGDLRDLPATSLRKLSATFLRAICPRDSYPATGCAVLTARMAVPTSVLTARTRVPKSVLTARIAVPQVVYIAHSHVRCKSISFHDFDVVLEHFPGASLSVFKAPAAVPARWGAKERAVRVQLRKTLSEARLPSSGR
eukprot:864822-Rhodomonas_salina.1